MMRYSSLCIAHLILLVFLSAATADWGTPNSAQYHIQTDEGPERYFRYQTDNGQFRKEKRLQDGTVIGTEAWIDALGYLRQKDYIADTQGYRILKSKTVFVGQNRPIQEAIKAAKKSPADAGTLVNPSSPAAPQRTYVPQEHSTTTTTARPNVIVQNPLGYDHYQSPNVLVVPNSKPLQAYLPAGVSLSTTTSSPNAGPPSIYVTPNVRYLASSTVAPQHSHIPANSLEAPFANTDDRFSKPIAVYGPSSTPAPPHADYGTPLVAYTPTSTERPGFLSAIASSSAQPQYQSTLSPVAIEQINNELEPPNYSGANFDAVIRPSTYRPPFVSSTQRPYYEQSGNGELNGNGVDVQPIFERNSLRQRPATNHYGTPQQYDNQIGNGYDPQYPYYDGVADTSNGFRYFLPRQYHEEDNSNPERRAGSFGYIDPFGIRRVVYYNTSPEGGFVHRKNNRYVGFNATPYDPQPI